MVVTEYYPSYQNRCDYIGLRVLTMRIITAMTSTAPIAITAQMYAGVMTGVGAAGGMVTMMVGAGAGAMVTGAGGGAGLAIVVNVPTLTGPMVGSMDWTDQK